MAEPYKEGINTWFYKKGLVERLNGSNEIQKVLVQKSSWRNGFYLVTIVAALMFLLQAVILELARQMALQSNHVYLGIHIVNSYLPINFGTILIGVWTALVFILICTHPQSTTKDIERMVYRIAIVFLALSWIWFLRTSLFGYWDYSTIPPVFPIHEALTNLPSNIYGSVSMIGIITILSVYTWYRWLRPSSWKLDSSMK